MTDILPFGPGAWVFITLYLASLLLLGWAGRAARKEDTLQDFYLAGRGFGFVVLLLTLYATQYSGNTFFGVAGATYRVGFGWLIAVHYMLAIIVFYLAFAPKLHNLSRSRGYVTPTDYLEDRYQSKVVSLVGSNLSKASPLENSSSNLSFVTGPENVFPKIFAPIAAPLPKNVGAFATSILL